MNIESDPYFIDAGVDIGLNDIEWIHDENGEPIVSPNNKFRTNYISHHHMFTKWRENYHLKSSKSKPKPTSKSKREICEHDIILSHWFLVDCKILMEKNCRLAFKIKFNNYTRLEIIVHSPNGSWCFHYFLENDDEDIFKIIMSNNYLKKVIKINSYVKRGKKYVMDYGQQREYSSNEFKYFQIGVAIKNVTGNFNYESFDYYEYQIKPKSKSK